MKLVFFFFACVLALNGVQGCARSVIWDDSWVHGVPCNNRLYPLWTHCCQHPRYDGCGVFGHHLWDYVKYSASWSQSVENYGVGYYDFYWDDSWVHGVPYGNYYYPLWSYCCQHPRCNKCGIFGHHLWDYVKYSASWSQSVENYGVGNYGFYWDDSWVHGVPYGNYYYPLWSYCCQHPRCNKCGIFGHHLWDYVKYSASWSQSVENYGVGNYGFYWDDSWVHGVPYGNYYYPLWSYCCQHPRCNKCGIFGHHLWDYIKYSASHSVEVDYGYGHGYGYHPRPCY